MSGKRIFVARTVRKFPVILKMLARGDLHLSGVYQLARHLTEDNHREILERAKHKTMRQIEELIAEIAPRADVPSRVVRLPCRKQTRMTGEESKHDAVTVTPRRPPSRVTPLSPQRYKIQVTISQETRDKLTEAQELMSYQIPNGDPAEILDKALDVLLEKMRKQKAAWTAKPRKRSTPREGRTRAIPAEIRREVFKRDGGNASTWIAGGTVVAPSVSSSIIIRHRTR